MPRVTVQSAEVYRTKRGQGDSAILVDAAGNTFVATREITGNDTDFYVRKISPAGVVMGEWEVQGANGYKIDGGDLGASGDHLLVATSAHDTPNPIPPDGRWSAMGLAHIPGVFVPFDNQAPEAGGPDAFTPTDPDPDPTPGGGGVTKAEVQWLLEHIIGADENNSLVNRFSHGDDVRGQIRIVDKQALVYLIDRANYEDLTDRDRLAKKFQDGLFEQVKNANAGVQENILGGKDEWGQARRDELKAIIREVVNEP